MRSRGTFVCERAERVKRTKSDRGRLFISRDKRGKTVGEKVMCVKRWRWGLMN